jgi:hypothetical protein
MFLPIALGFLFGAGIDIPVGGGLGGHTHGIGIMDTITILSISILEIILEVHSIEIRIGTIGIMEIMVGGLDQ